MHESDRGTVSALPLEWGDGSAAGWQDFLDLAEDLDRRIRRVVEAARECVTVCLNLTQPSYSAELAYHTIRLAQLAALYRSWTLPPDLEEASPDDIQDRS